MGYSNKIFALLMLAFTIKLVTIVVAQQTPGPADGTYAKEISECPQLKPRSSPPAGAHDLRPDDIKVIGALGDR